MFVNFSCSVLQIHPIWKDIVNMHAAILMLTNIRLQYAAR